MRKLTGILLALILSLQAMAQSDIPIDTWRTHNAYNKTIALASNDQEIIAATNSAIFTYNPTTSTSEQITRLSGLSDSRITALGFNESTETIIVTYANGNIDLISEKKISNFKDLLLADIPDSKRINHIFSLGSLAYLSADFGVMIIDLEKKEVKDSYFELGPTGSTIAIYSSTLVNDTLYLATAQGVIGGYINDNLKDFNLWRRYGATDGLPQTEIKTVTRSVNGLVAAFDEFGIFESINGAWEDKNLLLNTSFLSGSIGSNNNLLVTETMVYEYSNGVVTPIDYDLITDPRTAIYFNDEVVISDFQNGLIFPANQTFFYPNGPLSNEIVRLFGYEDKMVALPPAHDTNFKPLRNTAGFFIFSDGIWQNYNNSGQAGTINIPEFLDVTDAMYSYRTESLFLSSFGYGIMEMKDNETLIYDDSNSSLINTNPPGKNIYVSALDANSSVLAAVNFDTSKPYHALDIIAGSWRDFSVAPPADLALQIRGFENNTFWMRTPSTGITVFDSENQRQMVLDDNYLPANEVNDMVIDRQGKMWVATNNGVVFFYDAAFILDQSFIDPVSPIYDGQILFRNEKITALAVDGGNRIWMATSTGVWLFASDGLALIYNFNAENSPLPSNNVLSISINHQSGEVFFATDAGLVSYRSTATITPLAEPVKIFPNPVLLAQHDIITIQGVPTDADFWITDSSGRLVYKGKANGNTATWSGIASNSGLSSGVYFVFVADAEGEQKQVGKIAIVN